LIGGYSLGREYLDDEESVKKFWDNVIDMCNRRGITVTKLSLKLGKSPNHISNMKSQNINPTLVKIKNIAEALGIGITTLFKGI
jgi:transcriptional regulator with XRE-family HTH domain